MSHKVLSQILVVVLVVGLSDTKVSAQNSETPPLSKQYQCQTWDVRDGVFANIYSISQSYEGFLWFGCDQGAFTFDGIKYLPVDEESNHDAVCHSICVLKDSSVLCGFDKGKLIRYYQGKSTQIGTLDQFQESTISAICEDPDGGIWIGTDGAGLFLYSKDSLTHYHSSNGLPSLFITSIVTGEGDEIWAGTQKGLCRIKKGKISTITEDDGLSRNFILSLFYDSQNRLWIGTHGGLDLFQKNTIHVVKNEFLSLESDIKAITEDHDGNIWISSFGEGIYRFSPSLDKFEQLSTMAGLPSSTLVLSLFTDNESNIWLGFSGNFGLSQLQKPVIQTYTQEDGLSDNNILPLYASAQGTIWIGTAIGGLDCYYHGHISNHGDSLGLGTNPVYTIGEDSDHLLWVGSEGKLIVFNGTGVVKTYHQMGLDNSSFHSIFRARDGSLWVGTNDGIYIFRDGEISTLTKEDGLSDVRIFCFTEDSQGNIWIGTQNGGISIYRNGVIEHLSVEEGLSDEMILCMVEDSAGIMWVGTATGGLNRVDLAAGQITAYGKEDGLDNTIYQIFEDNYGCLWLGAFCGILSVDKDQFRKKMEGLISNFEPKVFSTSDIDQPLSLNGGIFPSGCKLPDGTLWFPTNQGIAVIHPDRMRAKVDFPHLVIQEMNVNHNQQPLASRYTFPPGVIYMEIKFTAPTFISADLIRFRYKLVGYDDDWVYPKGRSAYFTKIPYGSYEFDVEVTNRLGQWSGEIVKIPITIKPYFYQTIWFLLLSLLLGLFVIYAIVRYRIRYIREKELEVLVEARTKELMVLNRELDQRVLDRTAELAAANQELEAFTYSVSHDLRAPVRRIEGLVEAISDEYASQLDDTGKDYLAKVADSSQEMGQLIEEFLKLARIARQEIDKTELNLSELVSEITEELAQADPDRKVTITAEPDILSKGDPRLIRIALLNMLNNAWKYTSKSTQPEIIFGCQDEAGQKVFFIRDNGVGFDMSHYDKLFTPFLRLHSDNQFTGTGIGLATVKRIILKHGGKIWARSEPGKGSTFFFTL
ncbi:MAG: hypothetical protein D4R67_02015 [Bacteroidetes bacterium]|nr:MAG: hypothetical protein D4R67_02015 [Bacteroidota bacterium]